MSNKTTAVEKIILFVMFLVFALIIVVFAKNQNKTDNESSSSDQISLQYKTVSKQAYLNNSSDNKTSDYFTEKVNINTATIEQLDALPNIGKKRSESIIEYREANGGFEKIEDIMNVNGIGEKMFADIKDFIVV